MKIRPYVIFDSREESETFKKLIISSQNPEEAIEKARVQIKDIDGNAISLANATIAVGIFWEKKSSYIQRFKNG